MEALISTLIARRNGYTTRETFVPEPAESQPFDLRALSLSDDVEDYSPDRAPKTSGRALILMKNFLNAR
jgi:hypothetical protein